MPIDFQARYGLISLTTKKGLIQEQVACARATVHENVPLRGVKSVGEIRVIQSLLRVSTRSRDLLQATNETTNSIVALRQQIGPLEEIRHSDDFISVLEETKRVIAGGYEQIVA